MSTHWLCLLWLCLQERSGSLLTHAQPQLGLLLQLLLELTAADKATQCLKFL
jgi:hypothetical protein